MRATRNPRTDHSDTATWHDQVKLNQNNNPNKNVEERVMARPREILFVDPSVSDIDTILNGLRQGVEAIVLDPATPAVRQIAAALAGRYGLSAVHIIAHGAPGRVNFSSGDWSVTTLEDEAENLAAIGRALAVDGELRLWSCDAARRCSRCSVHRRACAGNGRGCRGLDRAHRRRRFGRHMEPCSNCSTCTCTAAAHRGGDDGLCGSVGDEDLGNNWHQQLDYRRKLEPGGCTRQHR